MEGLLFKILHSKGGAYPPSLCLCIPERYVPMILYQYHDHILAGHQGVTKMFSTISEKYVFPPNMYATISTYVNCCFECMSRRPKGKDRAVYYPRIPLDYRPMARISADVKDMPLNSQGFHYILLCTCEVSNYVVGIPIPNTKAETIAEQLWHKIVCVFGPPKSLIIDEAKSLTSQVTTLLYKSLKIQPITISPYNHGSNKTERYIQTLNNMICKYLKEKGNTWPQYVTACCYAMNTFKSAAIGWCPYELVFLHKPPDLSTFGVDKDEIGPRFTHTEYLKLLESRFQLMTKMTKARHETNVLHRKILDVRENPNFQSFVVGELVYLHAPTASSLQVNARKLKQEWIAPLKIVAILDESHYLVADCETDEILPTVMHAHRLKPFKLITGLVETSGELAKITRVEQIIEKEQQKESQVTLSQQ
jgi:hypothetical protein